MMNRPAAASSGVVAGHAHHPRARPQGLDGDHAAVAEKADRRHPAEVRMAPDLAHSCPAACRARPAAASQRGTFQAITAMDSADQRPPGPRTAAASPSRASAIAPASVEATMPNEPVISIQELARSWAVGSSQRRKPGERRHQAGAHAHTAEHAGRQQAGEAGGQRERHAAGHGDHQEAEDHLLGPMAVQPGSQAAAGLPRSRGNSRPPASPARCALSANSRVRVGDSVAVMARSSAEKK